MFFFSLYFSYISVAIVTEPPISSTVKVIVSNHIYLLLLPFLRIANVQNEIAYAESMEKLGSVALSREAETGIGKTRSTVSVLYCTLYFVLWLYLF